MKRKAFSVVLALALALVLLLAACSGGQQSTPSSEPAASQPAASQPGSAAPAGDASLRFAWWGGDARHEARLQAIELFQEKNPGVTVDAEYGGWDGYYQKITTMLAAGTEPDIMALSTDWIVPLGKSGDVFYNLESNPEWLDLSGFDTDLMASFLSINGQVQSLPISASNGNIFMVNTDFMDKFGVEPGTQWTWDSMVEEGERIHSEDANSYLFSTFGAATIDHLLKYYIIQHGDGHGWITAEYGFEFTEEDLVEGLTYFKQWVDKGVMQPVEETTLYQSPLENPEWVGGNVGMVNLFSGQTTLAISEELNLDVAAIPCIEGGVEDYGVTAGPAGCIAVSARTEYPEAALRFVNFFFNDMEAIEILNTTHGMQPVLAANEYLLSKGLLSEIDYKADEIVNLTRSPKFNITWQSEELGAPYNDNINAVLFGTLTPEQAGAQMFQELTEAAELLKEAA